MSPEPVVTVVTPSFNQGRFIRATIESVLSQDYPNLEYIIMDAGSTDETASVVKDYASRLTYISEPDRGQAHAINKGFRMARGEILSWLNSDDIFLPKMIHSAVRAFRSQPRAGAVYGEGYLIDQAGRVSSRFPWTEPFNLWKLTHLSDYILQQTVAFRKDVLDDVGYLNEDLHYVMDWEILIRIGKKYPLQYIPTEMGCLREYAAAKTFSGGKRRIRELGKMLRQHTGKLLPPGYISYGLDTHHRLWCEQVERIFPGRMKPVGNLLQSVIRSTAMSVIGHTIRDSQGLYSDGWASRRLRYMLPPAQGMMILEGDLPDWDQLKGQSLLIETNGVFAGEFRIPAGPFRLAVNIPDSLQNTLLELTILASRWISPLNDSRKLAYKLNSIRWAEPGETCEAPDAHLSSLKARAAGL